MISGAGMSWTGLGSVMQLEFFAQAVAVIVVHDPRSWLLEKFRAVNDTGSID
jgi:hypothetical protein